MLVRPVLMLVILVLDWLDPKLEPVEGLLSVGDNSVTTVGPAIRLGDLLKLTYSGILLNIGDLS